MKSILVVASDMEIGGAERALLGLLQAIDQSECRVDLFLLRHTGPFMQFIPEGVNVLPEKSGYSDLGVPIKDVLLRGHFDMVFGRAKGKYMAKRYIAKNNLKEKNSVEILYSFKYTLDYLPEISRTEYDLALGFTIPYYIVEKRVHAKKKAVWIHTDYSALDGDRDEELRVWEAYPVIVSISEAVTETFLKVYPTLEDRIYPIDNIVSGEMIRKQADMLDVDQEMTPEHGTIKILSIGRFSNAKNFDNIPDICCRLLESGLNVKWFLIGYGGDEPLIRQRIAEAGMQEHVVILGKKSNPYPYIKACNLYVQPSRYEGKCVTVREAQMLGKPVVITNYATAPSQLEDGVDGVVVPMDNAGCAEGIAQLLRDPQRMDMLSRNCLARDYSNAAEVEKLYKLME